MDPYKFIDYQRKVKPFESIQSLVLFKRLVDIFVAFCNAIQDKNTISFSFVPSRLPERIDRVHFLFDSRYWRSDIYFDVFKNPRDNYQSWKEITFNLPNDGFVYTPINSSTEDLTKIQPSILPMLEVEVAKSFPHLVRDKQLSFNYYNIMKDRVNVVFEDAIKKEKLLISFEYFPPQGDQ